MKKFLKTILFLCALSSIAYAEDDAMAILNKKRAEIEKAEKAKAKLAKEAEEKAKKEAEEQAKLAEKAKEQVNNQVVENVEVPTETVVATEGLNPQDEQEAMEILDGMRKKIKKEDTETLKLQQEAKELKEKQLGREELYAKLKEDSKIRWHRDEYKKLLKRFDEYYNKLEQKIADKEQQIVELTKLLEVLN